MAQDLSSTKRYLIPLFWVRRDNCLAYMIQHPNLLFEKELWYFSERSFHYVWYFLGFSVVVCFVLFLIFGVVVCFVLFRFHGFKLKLRNLM